MKVKSCKEALGKSLYQKLKKEDKLSLKHIAFTAEYITNGFNATEAYANNVARKGTKRPSCNVLGIELLKNIKIQGAIKTIMDSWLSEKKLKLESEIIHTLYQRAFYDPSTFANPDGSVKFTKWEEVPEESRCVVDGIEKKYYGKDASKGTTVLKLANREQAMRELSRYIQLYKEAESNTGSISDDTISKLSDVFSKALDAKPGGSG